MVAGSLAHPSARHCDDGPNPFINATGAREDTLVRAKVRFSAVYRTFPPRKAPECDYLVVKDCAAAQAVELVRALRHQLHYMTTQLARVECQDVTDRKGRAVRMEAAELRRDIKEAQALIDQLRRRYLNGAERTQQHPAGRQRRAMLDRQA
jgi:hypothetical protein